MKLSELDQDTRTKLKRLSRGASVDLGFILKRSMDPDVTTGEIRRLVRDALKELPDEP